MPEAMQVGCAVRDIATPLFLELYGYGPFLGRRNLGVRDPLRCRAASFRCGGERVLVIGNDLVTVSRSAVWAIRQGIRAAAPIPARCIMVCGSHTHSGPTVSRGIGWGELDQGFRHGWVRTAIEAGLAAIADEEPVRLSAGRSPLQRVLGVNRVREGGPTDPEIRWLRAERPGGGVKLLLHNHGMHGVIFGAAMRRVSADWPGVATQAVVDRGLAEHALFLQGAAGDINTVPCCCTPEAGEVALAPLVDSYLESLQAGLDKGQPMVSDRLGAAWREVVFPTKPCTPESLRQASAGLRQTHPDRRYLADRLEEMALYAERGGALGVRADLQVLALGDVIVHTVPGEPFVEVGAEIMRRSPGILPMVASIANGNCRYFPTRETFERYPDILGPSGYGYYEIHQGCGRFMPEYADTIAETLVAETIGLTQSLPG